MILKSDADIADSQTIWHQRLYLPIAAIAIAASAFHFWPFGNSRIWRVLNLPNLACIGVLVVQILISISKKTNSPISSSLPHVSVFAYLAVNFLSIAFAAGLFRSVSFTIKLSIVLTGGCVLFSLAAANERSIKTIYYLATVAAATSVGACLFRRFAQATSSFGFFESLYKYGSYIGILVPLGGIYLLSSRKTVEIFLGMVLIVCAYLSSGSIGAVAAITSGLLSALIFNRKRTAKLLVVISLALSTAALLAAGPAFFKNVWDDFKLLETDGKNLRQRYIEWQAEINLLESRGITGTGPGCINDYRSNFYYRLPKLNTLEAFDQNGWLTVAAETGILGLITFCWIIIHYGGTAVTMIFNIDPVREPFAHRFAAAAMAALFSACTANLFSSVHYNGVLIVFVLVLSLISAVNKVYIKGYR